MAAHIAGDTRSLVFPSCRSTQRQFHQLCIVCSEISKEARVGSDVVGEIGSVSVEHIFRLVCRRFGRRDQVVYQPTGGSGPYVPSVENVGFSSPPEDV